MIDDKMVKNKRIFQSLLSIIALSCSFTYFNRTAGQKKILPAFTHREGEEVGNVGKVWVFLFSALLLCARVIR